MLFPCVTLCLNVVFWLILFRSRGQSVWNERERSELTVNAWKKNRTEIRKSKVLGAGVWWWARTFETNQSRELSRSREPNQSPETNEAQYLLVMRILSDCGVMDLKILHCKNDSVEQEKARPIHQYKLYQRCSSHWSYVTKKMHLIYFSFPV